MVKERKKVANKASDIDPALIALIRRDPAFARRVLEYAFNAENDIDPETGTGIITLPPLSARRALQSLIDEMNKRYPNQGQAYVLNADPEALTWNFLRTTSGKKIALQGKRFLVQPSSIEHGDVIQGSRLRKARKKDGWVGNTMGLIHWATLLLCHERSAGTPSFMDQRFAITLPPNEACFFPNPRAAPCVPALMHQGDPCYHIRLEALDTRFRQDAPNFDTAFVWFKPID